MKNLNRIVGALMLCNGMGLLVLTTLFPIQFAPVFYAIGLGAVLAGLTAYNR